MRIVGIGAVIGQAHSIPSGERQLIENHMIDLRTFNEIYEVILQDCVFGRMSVTSSISGLLRIGPRIKTPPAGVKPDPPHPATSAGPPLCILPTPADLLPSFFLLHTNFVRRMFYLSRRTFYPLR